ncbi:MAG: methyltransferase [Oscillospiraceae bacterium]|nr:methyltransferase [Oscillospiraceae bacterium]
MAIPKFDPKELTVVSETPGFMGGAGTPAYAFPVTMREGMRALYRREPIWQITGLESTMFSPRVNPDNIARAFVIDGTGRLDGSGGGPDMFGIEWEYVPQVGGSMVRPGEPFLSDANEWKTKLKWPDIDKWDWEGARQANAEFLAGDKYVVCWFLNGWFERLISFMEFENAAFAMVDEDQVDAVKELFNALSDQYIKIFAKYLEYFPEIDGFCIHDDWGSQKETFFSPVLAGEVIVPAMRKVTDYLHAQGKFCELHSCGQALKQVPNFIAAGWDSWGGQLMNDTHKIYELYGDKILVGVTPTLFNAAETSESDQIAAAKEYAGKFCDPKKPSYLNAYGASVLTPAYRAALYQASRERYGS